MSTYNLTELGKFLTKRRKSLHIRQIDLADESISVAYISNLENGRFQPNEEKLHHLCKKLGIKMEELSTILQKVDESQNEEDLVSFQLMMIENDLAMLGSEEVRQELNRCPMPNNPLYQTQLLYLRGKYSHEKQKYQKAIENYTKSILIIEQHPFILSSNLAACCYCELSRVAYAQSDLYLAIQYAHRGIELYVPDGHRTYILYHLKICLVIYYQKLNRNEEAMKILDDLWNEMDLIQSTEVRLNMYEMRAVLLNRQEMYVDAIHTAKMGMEIARLDRAYERQLELWTALGTSYQKMNKLCEAKRCYQSAIKLMKKVRRDYLLITAKKQLGCLYMTEGDFQLAEKTLLEAAHLGKKHSDRILHCETLLTLSECYSKQNQNDKAEHYLIQALQISRELNLIQHEQNVLLALLKLIDKNENKYQKYVDRFVKISVILEHGVDRPHRVDGNSITAIPLEGDPPGT